MNYYRCSLYVQMKEGQLFQPHETREIANRVFEKSDIKILEGEYFCDFMALNLDIAQKHIILNMPYFKRCNWHQANVKYPGHQRYFVKHKDIRMFIEEIKPQHVGEDVRRQMFESLCKLIDMTQDEHVVNRYKTITSRKEMTGKPATTSDTANWLLLYHEDNDETLPV